MSKKHSFKFLHDVAIADTAFVATAQTIDKLFEAAAGGLVSSMADVDTIEKKEEKEFELENVYLDNLLYDFLDEILFYKDTENILFSKFEVYITNSSQTNHKNWLKGMWELKAICKGEKVNQKKHRIKTDIKAITMHMFKVVKTKDGFKATVVVDV